MLLLLLNTPAPAPGSAPTLIDHYTENRDGNVNMPASVMAGDLLLVLSTVDSTPPSAFPSPWQTIADVYGSGDSQTISGYWKIALGTEAGTVLTPGGTRTWLVYQYRGVDLTTPIGSVSTNKNDGASGAVIPDVTLTVPGVTTTTANSIVFALFGGDVTDSAPTYTYTTPSGFGNKLSNQEDYDTLCAFDKVQVAAGASGSVACAMNTAGIMGMVFVINAPAGSSTPVRALVISSGSVIEITDVQIGTGLKPLVSYLGNIKERSASEGTAIVLDGGTLKEMLSSETLLI